MPSGEVVLATEKRHYTSLVHHCRLTHANWLCVAKMTEKEDESDLFGPSLPPGWVEPTQACEPTDREAGSGKRSPVSSAESEDDLLIGPLPPAEGEEDSKKSAVSAGLLGVTSDFNYFEFLGC